MNHAKVLPQEIENLRELEVLDLSSGALFKKLSIPTEVKHLKKLRILNLKHNWPYSEEEMNRIKELLPNCEITFPTY